MTSVNFAVACFGVHAIALLVLGVYWIVTGLHQLLRHLRERRDVPRARLR